MSQYAALGGAVVALLCAAGIIAGVILAERAKSADRCSRCRHFRELHRAEGCTACGDCERFQ